MAAGTDISGRRFGLLVVRHCAAQGTHTKQSSWSCACDCGETVVVRRGNLTSGNTTSCGCAKRAASKARGLRHGHYIDGKQSPEYRSWASMIARCTNPNAESYERYGGRGITICESWRESFAAFLADVGPRPSLQHSLEREDNAIGYQPGNCRWATVAEQSRNKRSTVRITLRGETRVACDWARSLGLSRTLIYERLKRGITDPEQLLAPSRRVLKQHNHETPP
jgi:hypothetical protein